MISTPPIQLPHKFTVTDDQFWELAHANPDLRLERTATGEVIIALPTGGEGGNYNAEVTTDITLWNRQTQLGKVFDSSTGFRLPNGATRSPDTAWIANERWNTLAPEERQKFAPICPDFVLELASPSDEGEALREKMQEYLANGCRLGWLILPQIKQVEIYRPNSPVEILSSPTALSGETVLPGFELNLSIIFK